MQKFGKFVAVMCSPVLLAILLTIAAIHHEAGSLLQLSPKPAKTHTIHGSGPRAQARSQARHPVAVAPSELPRVPAKPEAHRAEAHGGTPMS
jgi:hypothetical protein